MIKDHIGQLLKIESEAAVNNGYEFLGYFGYRPDEFSKEQLIMLLNVMHRNLKVLQDEYYKSQTL